jgi:hypothetical protein
MAISPDVGTPEEDVPEPGVGHPGEPAPVRSDDVIKTYRYLRIGMIGAVVLLFVSILIERSNVACWQRSISAYYYTPVRAIFVGSLMAVGLSLIVYKGRSRGEDPFLNFAGMLAPVVAIVPTTNVGTCWSVPPEPSPLTPERTPAGWVVANIDNNFDALLITGAIGLAVTAFIALFMSRKNLLDTARSHLGTTVSLIGTGVALLVAWWLSENRSDFYTKAHSFAAVAMFVLLIGAIVSVALDTRNRGAVWWLCDAALAALMVAGAIVIGLTGIFGDHKIFVLETYEIALFAVYWGIQTAEKWHERPEPTIVRMTVAPAPGGEPSGLVPGSAAP